MVKKVKKSKQTKNNSKLKTLKLPTCTVVLHNIAFNKSLIQRYKLRSFNKKKDELRYSSLCMNASKSSSIWTLKEWEDSTTNAEDNTYNETFRVTRSQSKKLSRTNHEDYKSITFLDNNMYLEVIQTVQEQQLKCDSNIEILSNKSNDETSMSSSTYYDNRQKKIEKTTDDENYHNNESSKLKNRIKKKLFFNESDSSSNSIEFNSDNENYLNMKKIDCDKKMRMISNKIPLLKIPRLKSDMYNSIKENSNNLHSACIAGKTSTVKLECEKNKNVKTSFSGVINTNRENKTNALDDDETSYKPEDTNLSSNFSSVHNDEDQNQNDTSLMSDTSLTTNNMQLTNITLNKKLHLMKSETNCVTKKESNYFLTYNERYKTCKTYNKNTTKKDKPTIIENRILPKDTIKFINPSNENLQNTSSKQVSSEAKNEYINSNMKQICYVNDTFGFLNIKEKECHTFNVNKSFDMLNISKFSSTFNNNINQRNDKYDDKFHNKKTEHEDGCFIETRNNMNNNDKIIEKCKNNTLKCQKQSYKLDCSKEYENNILHNNKSYDTNLNKIVLNENTSNFIDISENCNIDRSLTFSNNENIKQERKRIANENAIDTNVDNKKRKLNRTMYLQNRILHCKSLNQQQTASNDCSDTNTKMKIKSDIMKDDFGKQGDLREHLNEKRSKPLNLSQSENEVNNKNIDQKNLNNINDIISLTSSTKNEECNKKFCQESISTEILYEEEDNQMDQVSKSHIFHSMLQNISEKTQYIDKADDSIHEDIDIQKKSTISENKDDDDDDDDDYISLFAESFDTDLYESIALNKSDKQNNSLHLDVPYVMSFSSFDKYVKQNATEFNKEYAKQEKIKEISIKIGKIEKDTQSKEIVHSNDVSKIKTITSPERKNEEIKTDKLNLKKKCNIWNFIYGYCFSVLRKGICYEQELCKYKRNIQDLLDEIYSQDTNMILNLMREALLIGYKFLCKCIYLRSLQKLTIDQILITYKMFHNVLILKNEPTLFLKKTITKSTVIELLNRQISLKIIVNLLVECIASSTNLNDFMNILISVKNHIKYGEYWSTVKALILRLPPDKIVIEHVLLECVENKNVTEMEDINNNLLNKLSSVLISTLNKNIVERFKNFLATNIANNPTLAIENDNKIISETIASPDENSNLSEINFPKYSNTFASKNISEENYIESTESNTDFYKLKYIDDLPEPQSVYRDHKHLWKFFVDLNGFKKGLMHNDYDYVINILQKYVDKSDKNSFFVRSCCKILCKEVKRSEHHLENIIRRTVQMGTFNILGKILFDIGLNLLFHFMDNEIWGLALSFIQVLNIYNISYNAKYFLLMAEIYLANQKVLKAYDLLKSQNIICTNRNKWHVDSTINDESIRNKIMQIILDSFCNELFIEYAFYLFQFLLKDQYSQYYPIDLSRYVDKIILFLLKKDTNLIIEMANLILKYAFALSTTVCRALISSLIYLDENLARQMYNYAENMGIYPAMKLWPVTHMIIYNDLTEEEIYLMFLQSFKNLIINFGHTIEFAKYHQIKVYLILEIKSDNVKFYSAELQNYYNNKIIANTKASIKDVLKKRFDPPIALMKYGKGRIYRLQSKSIINYLKTEHWN